MIEILISEHYVHKIKDVSDLSERLRVFLIFVDSQKSMVLRYICLG